MEYARYTGSSWITDDYEGGSSEIYEIIFAPLAIIDKRTKNILEIIDESITLNLSYEIKNLVAENMLDVTTEEANTMLYKFLRNIILISVVLVVFLSLNFFTVLNSGEPFDPVFHIFKVLIPGTWGLTAFYALHRVKGGINA